MYNHGVTWSHSVDVQHLSSNKHIYYIIDSWGVICRTLFYYYLLEITVIGNNKLSLTLWLY